jgi:hypothetical protein
MAKGPKAARQVALGVTQVGDNSMCGVSRPEVALCSAHFVTHPTGPKQLSGKDVRKLLGHAGKSRLYSG